LDESYSSPAAAVWLTVFSSIISFFPGMKMTVFRVLHAAPIGCLKVTKKAASHNLLFGLFGSKKHH
jgi:hypothetical protein